VFFADPDDSKESIMSRAELAQIIEAYHVHPSALAGLHAWISGMLRPIRDALRAPPGDATLEGVRRPIGQTLDTLEETLLACARPEGETWSQRVDATQADAATVMQSIFFEDHQQREGRAEKSDAALTGEGSRYEDLGLIGVGGMGEVRRVRERDLNRTLAMKIIKHEVMAKKSSLARFIEEAQVSAQLQHPSIIPVHELGRMPDGRYYFTMQEIRGRELDDAITSVHDASQHGWQYDAHGWSLRQLITALQKACQAVGYAHARGVIHRDLKPSNIMVGRDGEVFVLDWGIAKVKGDLGEEEGIALEEMIETNRSLDASQATRIGAVTGTPAYMSPEQAEGRLDEISARSDVYALGAILYKILTGRVPYQGHTVWQTLMAVAKAELQWPSVIATKKIPDVLEEICVRALSADPEVRYVDARALADELSAWLDGAKQHERALELVQAAHQARLESEDMRRRADVVRAEGKVLLEDIPRWAAEQDKHKGWALEDEASVLEQRARLKALEVTQTLHAALTYVPEMPEVHQTLAEHYREQHRHAEWIRDEAKAKADEILLHTHTEALPQGKIRQGFATYLKGQGALTLVTEPAGAEVQLYRFVTKHRRLVPEFVRSLGHTPLAEVPLEMGSYLLELHKEGHEVVHYPVSI